MKSKIIILASLLFLGISILEAQEMKDFAIENLSSVYIVKPNFMTTPDFTKSSRVEIKDQKYFASLVDDIRLNKLKNIIDNKINSQRSRIKICLDKDGKIIYAYFELDKTDKPGEKLTEKDLRKIMDAFTCIKLDMSKFETNFEQNKKFELGILFIKLKKKQK